MVQSGRSYSFSFSSDNPHVLYVNFGSNQKSKLQPPAAGISDREVEAVGGAEPAPVGSNNAGAGNNPGAVA
jgi:hypothetical protein